MIFLSNVKIQYLPYVVIGIISTVLMIIYNVSDWANINDSLWVFERTHIKNGELWRLITGHFLHTNVYHFVMNIIGLVLLCLLHGEYASTRTFAFNVVILCVATSIAIYFFSENIIWYVGLSGILHGIFAWGVIIDIKLKRKSGYILLVGLIIKLFDEQFLESSTFMANLIEANVAVDAHLYGAVAGLILGLFHLKHIQRHDTQ